MRRLKGKEKILDRGTQGTSLALNEHQNSSKTECREKNCSNKRNGA